MKMNRIFPRLGAFSPKLGLRKCKMLWIASLWLCFSLNGFTQQKIYWVDADTDKIQRADLDGSNVENLVTIAGSSHLYGFATDLINGKMYWSDEIINKIQRADLDGNNIEDLVTTGLGDARGLALDLIHGKIYWVDAGLDKIRRADLDGTNGEDLVTTGLSNPWGIALDINGGKMYWSDYGINKIQRADLDGNNVENVVTGLSNPWGIALDINGGKIYWSGSGGVWRADLSGSNIENVVTGLNGTHGLGLDLNNGKMYWGDFGINKIQRADLDGNNVENVVTSGLDDPAVIDIQAALNAFSDSDSPVATTTSFTDDPLSLDMSYSDAGSQVASVEVIEINNMTFTIDTNDFSHTGVYTTGLPAASVAILAEATGGNARVVYKVTDGNGNVKMGVLDDK